MRLGLLARGPNGHHVLLTVAHAPVILAPRHFIGIRAEVRASDMMMSADFRAARAALRIDPR